jgi:hypothetical protein
MPELIKNKCNCVYTIKDDNYSNTKNMTKIFFFILVFILTLNSLYGQTNPEILIPSFNDKYTEFVKKLEGG